LQFESCYSKHWLLLSDSSSRAVGRPAPHCWSRS
jgi:hypothetical protein